MMKIVGTVSWIAAIVAASSLAVVMPAFAQENVGIGAGAQVQAGIHDGIDGVRRAGAAPGIFGTVSAVNGSTLSVTARMAPSSASGVSSTVYTVDASNARIYKDGATTTVPVSDISVGDIVVVQGTVTGTNVAATVIRDGIFPRPVGGPVMPIGGRRFDRGASSTPAIQGNGEPVVGGSVTAINGTTLTITNASNVTYTINAASTTIVRNGTSSVLSNIAVGDSIIVQGTVNGTFVTATSIIDRGAGSGTASSSTNVLPLRPHDSGFGFGIGGGLGGFFGAIGGFFRHLFGF